MKSTVRLFLTFLCLSIVGPKAQAVSPPPDGCYSNFTTVEGCDALNSLTTGAGNTAVGWRSLFFTTTGSHNTAVGNAALHDNTTGISNTAVGTIALVHNTTGFLNTAIGNGALDSNTTGSDNTANGNDALFHNTTGNHNAANGHEALLGNTTGHQNTAIGSGALQHNTTGGDNVALGFTAGNNATTGSGNVYIGTGMDGEAGEENHTYIRNVNNTTVSGTGTDTVTVNLTTGLLGHMSSSRRYKENIRPMDKASEAVFALKPVTYHYKKEIDPNQSPAFGLIAEEVAQVNPNLVACNSKGQPEGVQYEMVNAMLLNEFLKEHRKVEEQAATITQLKAELQATSTRQQKQIDALTAGLQKVSAQLAVNKPTSQTIANNH